MNSKPSNILQEPYHRLVTYHLPKEHTFHNIRSFKDTVGPLKAEHFVDSPLSIDNNLDFRDIMRFISFRFWYAYNKFPTLQTKLEQKYEKTITAFSKNDEMLEKNAFIERLNLQKSLLWHLTRALTENDEKIVERTLVDFDFTIYVTSDDYQESIDAIAEIKKYLLKIFDSAAFKEAVITFGIITKTPLTSEAVSKLIEDVKKLKIVPITITPASLYGMVLPDGIALNFTNIRELIKPEEENLGEAIIKVGLWVAIHEIGHLIIRSEVMSNKLYFAKMTPPSEYLCSGQNYKNLEAGFLFSIIFLGTLDKMIWENPDLISKLVHLDVSSPIIPILSVEELEGTPTIEFKNLTNSGALMMKTQRYRPIKLY